MEHPISHICLCLLAIGLLVVGTYMNDDRLLYGAIIVLYLPLAIRIAWGLLYALIEALAKKKQG